MPSQRGSPKAKGSTCAGTWLKFLGHSMLYIFTAYRSLITMETGWLQFCTISIKTSFPKCELRLHHEHNSVCHLTFLDHAHFTCRLQTDLPFLHEYCISSFSHILTFLKSEHPAPEGRWQKIMIYTVPHLCLHLPILFFPSGLMSDYHPLV